MIDAEHGGESHFWSVRIRAFQGNDASIRGAMTSKAGNWRNEGIPLLLTLVGGSVDAMVILGFNVLTAAQTGNTVLLAVAIARGDLVTGASAATSSSSPLRIAAA